MLALLIALGDALLVALVAILWHVGWCIVEELGDLHDQRRGGVRWWRKERPRPFERVADAVRGYLARRRRARKQEPTGAGMP